MPENISTAEMAEAQAIACEKIIAALPSLLDRDSLQNVMEWLEMRQILQDGQEDPGAVETEGLGVELAIARSFRRMLETLRGASAGTA